jgi:AGZA family xanthine/uracil permease-like MFS transporter
MTGGDWGSLTQLFFDNLSTLLGALYAIQAMADFGVPTDDINQIIWGKLVPGVGITLCFGNVFYTWQAIRLTKKWGRPYTAQPYGLNTPAAFAFVYNIMCKFMIMTSSSCGCHLQYSNLVFHNFFSFSRSRLLCLVYY